MLELFQFEGCPYCAKVRSCLNDLELDYICRTVPRGSKKRELILLGIGGKDQVPFLIDHDRGVAMYESEDIVDYLRKHYSHTPKKH